MCVPTRCPAVPGGHTISAAAVGSIDLHVASMDMQSPVPQNPCRWEECCEPKCSQYTCFGSWATDASKNDQASATESIICVQLGAVFRGTAIHAIAMPLVVRTLDALSLPGGEDRRGVLHSGSVPGLLELWSAMPPQASPGSFQHAALA